MGSAETIIAPVSSQKVSFSYEIAGVVVSIPIAMLPNINMCLDTMFSSNSAPLLKGACNKPRILHAYRAIDWNFDQSRPPAFEGVDVFVMGSEGRRDQMTLFPRSDWHSF